MSLYLSDDSRRDDFYEWLLSDAPAAQAERQRRFDEATRREQAQRRQVQAWSHATETSITAPDDLVELARTMDTISARQQLRDAEMQAMGDEARVRRSRADLEAYRHSLGDTDYLYPAAYLGPGAAHQPIPDEATRPVDLRPGMRVREFIGGREFTVAHVHGGPDRAIVIDTDGRRHDYDTPVHVGIVRDDRYADHTVDLEQAAPAVAAVDGPEPDWLDIEDQGLCRGCLDDPCRCSTIDVRDAGDPPVIEPPENDFGVEL